MERYTAVSMMSMTMRMCSCTMRMFCCGHSKTIPDVMNMAAKG